MVEREPLELLGLLIGSWTSEALWIERCQPMYSFKAPPHSESNRPVDIAKVVSHALQDLPDGMSPVGLFRTQTAGWLDLRDTDRELASWTNSSDLFLLIRTSFHRPWSCLSFMPDAQGTLTSQLEFHFDESRCTTEPVAREPQLGQYGAAVSEYHRITRYLNAATGILTRGESSLLLEFAEIAKRKYERLRRRITKHAA